MYEELKILIKFFIAGLQQFITSPYWPSLSEEPLFLLWCAMIIHHPELHDHRFAWHGSTRVSVTWFQIPKSIKLMWLEARTQPKFFFSAFSSPTTSLLPRMAPTWFAWFWTKSREIMVSTSLLTRLITRLKVTFLPPLCRTDANKEPRQLPRIHIYS